MNREIKFRAFSAKSGMWSWNKLTVGHPLSCLYSHDSWQVMQFTGLKDKNGVDIYEGDILQQTEGQPAGDGNRLHPAWTAVVCFKTDPDNGLAKFDFGQFIWKPSCSEVIGNIHENPELIEKENLDVKEPAAA